MAIEPFAERDGREPAVRTRAVLLMLLCVLSFGVAAEEKPAETELGELTVEALRDREVLERKVSTYVSSITVGRRHEALARWQSPICPLVAGLPAEKGKFVFTRLSEVIDGAGARLDKEGCGPNLLVVMTFEPEALLKKWWGDSHTLFNNDRGVGGIKRTIATPAPVRVFYNACSIAPGMAKSLAKLGKADCGAGTPGSRLVWDVVRMLYSVIVVVDLGKIDSVKIGALTDYIAMSALAQVRMNEEPDETPTILRLFNVTDAERPQGLSPWDAAFLKSLYQTDSSAVMQVAAVKRQMVDDLVVSR